SAAIEASAFWLGIHTSALSGVMRTVQLLGSMQECERKGVLYTASSFFAEPEIAFNASPWSVSAKTLSLEVRPSLSRAAMVAVDSLAFAPSSHLIGIASSALFACQ